MPGPVYRRVANTPEASLPALVDSIEHRAAGLGNRGEQLCDRSFMDAVKDISCRVAPIEVLTFVVEHVVHVQSIQRRTDLGVGVDLGATDWRSIHGRGPTWR